MSFDLIPLNDGRLRLNVGADPALTHKRKDGHRRYIFAADIGGVGDDPSAIVLMESESVPSLDQNGQWQVTPTKRTIMWADMVRQPDTTALVDFFCKKLQHLQAIVAPSPVYCTHDATGMGAPVTDLFKQAGVKPHPVTITAGNAVTPDRVVGGGKVSKAVLMEKLQIDVHNGSLTFAEGMPMLQELFEHIASLEIIQSSGGSVSYKQGGKGHHSDLLMATAIALTVDRENLIGGGGRVKQIRGLI